LAVFLYGRGNLALQDDGRPILDDSFYLMFNAQAEPLTFTLPGSDWFMLWDKVLDTADPAVGTGGQPPERLEAGQDVQVAGRSIVVLQHGRQGALAHGR
jgi:glycogen operon protein